MTDTVFIVSVHTPYEGWDVPNAGFSTMEKAVEWIDIQPSISPWEYDIFSIVIDRPDIPVEF